MDSAYGVNSEPHNEYPSVRESPKQKILSDSMCFDSHWTLCFGAFSIWVEETLVSSGE